MSNPQKSSQTYWAQTIAQSPLKSPNKRTTLHKVLTTFHSYETDQAFTECCDCGCHLHDAEMYIINQSFVGDECVFELAMCLPCRERMNEQLSEDSRVAMFDFMHDNADMEARIEKLSHDSKTEDYIQSCVTCDKPRAEAKSFTLGAMFSADHLLKGPFPLLICDDCEAKIAATISDETRKFWDNYITEHFPGPPSEVDLPQKTKPILI